MDTRKKRIIILSIMLGALALIFIFGNIFSRSRTYAGKYEVTILPNFDAGEVYSYVLFDQDNRTQMIRDVEKGWFIRKGGELFPADSKKIENFEEKLAGASTERLVTEKEENYEELGIGDEKKGIELYDADGELLHTVLIGTPDTAAQGGAEYVKRGDSDRVYVIKDSLDFYIARNSSYWEDLHIFKDLFTAEEVMEVHLSANGIILDEEAGALSFDYSIALIGEEGRQRWVLTEDPDIEILMSKTEAVVNSIASLRGDSFVPREDAPDDIFANQIASAAIYTDDKREFLLTVGPQHSEDAYYVKINSSPYIYSVKNWALEKIFKEKSGLLPAEDTEDDR